jgi:hypothetical protein
VSAMAHALLGLLALQEYGAKRCNVFPSKTSMAWFVRQHKEALVSSGALLMITGRWFVDADRFDTYVLSEGGRAAVAHTRRNSEP